MKINVDGDFAGQMAGERIENHISVDVRVAEGAALDQHISIGTIFTGPVHIHLTIGRAVGDPGEK